MRSRMKFTELDEIALREMVSDLKPSMFVVEADDSTINLVKTICKTYFNTSVILTTRNNTASNVVQFSSVEIQQKVLEYRRHNPGCVIYIGDNSDIENLAKGIRPVDLLLITTSTLGMTNTNHTYYTKYKTESLSVFRLAKR